MNPSKQSSDQLADLTKQITRTSPYCAASGGFGEVWRCILRTGVEEIVVRLSRTNDYHHLRSFQVAVKVIRLEGAGVNEKVTCNIMTPIYVLTCCVIQALRLELGTWRRLCHANILPLLGTTEGFAPHLSMVSPWLENGSLTDYFRKHQDMTLPDRLRIVSFQHSWTQILLTDDQLQDVTLGLHYCVYQDLLHVYGLLTHLFIVGF
jgi:hypothetical protein